LQNRRIRAKRMASVNRFISQIVQVTMATSKTKASGTAKQKNNSDQAPSATASPALGKQFQEAREARDLSIDTVANELMIRKFYLTSLEEGSYRNLPERVYAVGFVRSYAELLGLDKHALVEQFKREAYGSRAAQVDRIELNMPTPTSQSMLPPRGTILTIGTLLVVLVIGGLIWNAQSNEQSHPALQPPPSAQIADDALSQIINQNPDAPAADTFAAPVPETTSVVSSTGTVTTANPTQMPPEQAPSATPDTQANSVPEAAPVAEQAQAAETPAAPAAAAPAGTRILVEALQPSWVEIADADGNILYTNILRVGQALPIPNKAGITLTTGNASGVQLVLDGKKLGPLGRAGEVKRGVSLNPDSLTQR
jgi:cytoskeleton protein RodZ